MDQIVLDFISDQHLGVLTTLLKDGSPHGAVLHYSHQAEPLEFYFSTDRGSRKVGALLDGGVVKAALVVGFSEQDWVTLQLDGEVSAVLDAQELEAVEAVHYAKHPSSAKWKGDPSTLFLKFTPTWWRYTNSGVKPPVIITSD